MAIAKETYLILFHCVHLMQIRKLPQQMHNKIEQMKEN